MLSDLPEALLLAEPDPHASEASQAARRWRQRAVRTLCLWVVAACAFPCSILGVLNVVEAVTGAMCSMLASIALPCVCWAALYWGEVPRPQLLAAVALASIATAAGGLMTYVDFMRIFDEGKEKAV